MKEHKDIIDEFDKEFGTRVAFNDEHIEEHKEIKDFLLEEIKKVEERAYEKGYAKKNNELFLEERKRWEEEQKWIDIPNEVVEAVKKEERKIFLDKIEGMKIPIGSGGYLTEEGCMHNKLIDKILINLT